MGEERWEKRKMGRKEDGKKVKWKGRRSRDEPVAQRQEMVIGTLALLSGLFMVAF